MADRTILITGASDGIGRALALQYARPGTRLLLIARNQERLRQAADLCRQRGADVETALADVRDRAGMTSSILAMDRASAIDLVVANAGINGGTHPDGRMEAAEDSVAQIEVNLLGVLNTVHPLLPRMMERKRGQIAIVGSIAGLMPLPDSPSYCASKAAVLSYGQALRGALRSHGIGVTVICAGFVETRMSARLSGWKPGQITPERAAEIIAVGIDRNRAVVTFPRLLGWLARIGALLPELLRRPFLSLFRFTVSPPVA